MLSELCREEIILFLPLHNWTKMASILLEQPPEKKFQQMNTGQTLFIPINLRIDQT